MKLDAFRKFNLELDRIELLYHATIYSYDTASEAIGTGFRDSELDSFGRIQLASNEEKNLLLSRKKLKIKYSKKLPREISQLVFVRSVSVLEVYIISQVRELFLARRDLFHSQDRISFSRGELLNSGTITEIWIKLINKELRNLQNKSLNEKSKYYSKYLNINFEQSSEYPLPLERIHDMRHLVVHRLGKTDEQFRKKYKTDVHSLIIDEEELSKAISSIRTFGQYVFDQSSILLNEDQADSTPFKASVHVELLRDRVRYIFDFNYKFIDGENLVWCSDFVKKVDLLEENKIYIEMVGDQGLILSFLRLLKKLHNGQSINIINISPENCLENQNPPGRRLDDLEISELARNLPIMPWKKDIHKRVASQLDTSNNVISKAIDKILEDSSLEVLLGEDVKYS